MGEGACVINSVLRYLRLKHTGSQNSTAEYSFTDSLFLGSNRKKINLICSFQVEIDTLTDEIQSTLIDVHVKSGICHAWPTYSTVYATSDTFATVVHRSARLFLISVFWLKWNKEWFNYQYIDNICNCLLGSFDKSFLSLHLWKLFLIVIRFLL